MNLKPVIDQMVSGTRDERVYISSKSFPAFFLYYYLDSIKYPFAGFHFEAMKNLESLINSKDKREFLWVAHRESAKSTIARAFLTWLILNKYRNYIIVGSYDQANAESTVFSVINQLQTNVRLRADFGNLCPEQKKEEKGFNRIKKFLTNNGVLIEALTTQQSARGRLHKDSRPDFALLDDIESYKTAISDVVTNKTKEFLKELRTAMDSKDGRLVYLANHFSDLGVVQELIDQKDTMYYQNNPVYLSDLSLTWPAKYGEEEGKISIDYLKKLAKDSITFETEYLNQPFSEERRVFKKSLIKYVDVLPDGRLSCFFSLDPAFTTKEESDFTGVSIVWLDKDGMWYVKAFRQKFTPKELIDFVFVLYEQYKPEKIGIEEIGFTQGLKPFLDDEMRRRNKHLPMVMLKHNSTHKETRIRGLLSYFEAGTIHLLKNECSDLEEELLRFPHSQFDDVMDSLAYMPQMVFSPFGKDQERQRVYSQREYVDNKQADAGL